MNYTVPEQTARSTDASQAGLNKDTPAILGGICKSKIWRMRIWCRLQILTISAGSAVFYVKFHQRIIQKWQWGGHRILSFFLKNFSSLVIAHVVKWPCHPFLPSNVNVHLSTFPRTHGEHGILPCWGFRKCSTPYSFVLNRGKMKAFLFSFFFFTKILYDWFLLFSIICVPAVTNSGKKDEKRNQYFTIYWKMRTV